MRLAAALILATAMMASPAGAEADRGQPLRIVSIDAEGGAASLIVTPDGRSLLVDTGWPSDQPPPRNGGQFSDPSTADLIVSAAAELGVSRIDYLLVTHYHLDHVGGVPDLLARMPVGMVIDHGPNRETWSDYANPGDIAARLFDRYEAAIAGLPRRTAVVGETLNIGALTLTFVASDAEAVKAPLSTPAAGLPVWSCDTPPTQTAVGDEENQRSVGFVASFGGARILNLADLTWNVERELVCPTNRLGRIDLLMVSHHGSAQSTTPPLLEATAPRIALMSNGAHKGGDAAVLASLASAPSSPVVWQQHFALRSPEANGAPERIANLAVHNDAGHAIEVAIWPDGAIRVTNRRNGYREDYPARRPW